MLNTPKHIAREITRALKTPPRTRDPRPVSRTLDNKPLRPLLVLIKRGELVFRPLHVDHSRGSR